MLNTEFQYLMNWYNWGSLQTKHFNSIEEARQYISYFQKQGGKFSDLRLFDKWNKRVIEL